MTQLHIAVREGRKAVIPTALPVVFSAGPIRNGPIWQNSAMRWAVIRNEAIFFASPLREGEDGFDEDLQPHLAPFTGEENFSRQRAWEQYYLNQAAVQGCVFFWLAKPLRRNLWKYPEKSYAQMTMLELGGWLKAKELQPETRLVIGAEEGFPELSTIRFEIETVTGLPVYETLKDTVNAAIDIALS